MDTAMQEKQAVVNDPSSLRDDEGPREERRERGCIALFLGCVKSGKTERLNMVIRTHHIAQMEVCAIQYGAECTGPSAGALMSSSGTSETGHVADRLARLDDMVVGADVVAIDRGHLFPDLADVCVRWADAGKIVFVSALVGDYKRRLYEQVGMLIPDAEIVEYLTAICTLCAREAPFSALDENGEFIPVCRKCFVARDDKEGE